MSDVSDIIDINQEMEIKMAREQKLKEMQGRMR